MSFDAKVKVLCQPTAALSDLHKLQTAVRQCSDRFMLNVSGRKALLLLTDGVDEGSRTTVDEAIDHAQRADTVVFSILYADPKHRGGFQVARGRHILTELARQTGGGFFTVTKEQPLEQILDEIQLERRTQYSIGFVPDGGQAGEYRKLSLRTLRTGLAVQARAGYYPR